MSRVQTRPELAAIFFSMYVGMVFIVCINMFIGIITKYFEEVRFVFVSPCAYACRRLLPLCLCVRTLASPPSPYYVRANNCARVVK